MKVADKIDLSIVIVTWNVKAFLENCLRSVLKHNNGYSTEIIVVDNASRDGTASCIRNNFPEVKFIQNKRNLGFSRANNQGIATSQGQYLAFLNPDTILLEDSFARMIDVMKSNENIGAVGCMLVDKTGRIDYHCAKHFPTIGNLIFEPYLPRSFTTGVNKYTMSDWDHKDNRAVDVLSGACLTVKREVLDRIGHFDENIFMYVDDVELCYRIKKGGWLLFYLADTHIIHYGQQSTKQKYVEMNAESVRSMRKFFSKHRSIFYGIVFEILVVGEYLVKSFALSLVNLFKRKHAPSTIRNYRAVAWHLIFNP